MAQWLCGFSPPPFLGQAGQAQAESPCWGWDAAKQCPWLPTATEKSDTKGREEMKRTLLFLSNTYKCPTKLILRTSWAWCGFSVNFGPTTLSQPAPEFTVNSNIHRILQKGVPSSAACYEKDHTLYFALNLSSNYLLPSHDPEFLLLSAETANNCALRSLHSTHNSTALLNLPKPTWFMGRRIRCTFYKSSFMAWVGLVIPAASPLPNSPWHCTTSTASFAHRVWALVHSQC